MKWVLYVVLGLVGLVLLAVIGLKLAGLRKDAGRIAHTIEIARPPEQVFRWIQDPARVKQWLSWLVEIRRDPSSPEGVGAREVFVMEDKNNKNQKMELQSEVTKYDPPRAVSVRIDFAGMAVGEVDYVLTPTATGTTLSYDSRYDYQHWAASLFEPLVTPSAKDKLVGDLTTLKRLAEAEPAQAPAVAAP